MGNKYLITIAYKKERPNEISLTQGKQIYYILLINYLIYSIYVKIGSCNIGDFFVPHTIDTTDPCLILLDLGQYNSPRVNIVSYWPSFWSQSAVLILN